LTRSKELIRSMTIILGARWSWWTLRIISMWHNVWGICNVKMNSAIISKLMIVRMRPFWMAIVFMFSTKTALILVYPITNSTLFHCFASTHIMFTCIMLSTSGISWIKLQFILVHMSILFQEWGVERLLNRLALYWRWRFLTPH